MFKPNELYELNKATNWFVFPTPEEAYSRARVGIETRIIHGGSCFLVIEVETRLPWFLVKIIGEQTGWISVFGITPSDERQFEKLTKDSQEDTPAPQQRK